jgi:hypothetical protein
MRARSWAAVALVPVPLAIYDAVQLGLWRTQNIGFLALGIVFTLVYCALVCGAVRGAWWLLSRFHRWLATCLHHDPAAGDFRSAYYRKLTEISRWTSLQ